VADEWGTDFVQNFHKLNLLEPYKLIKATSCINEDLELVRTLKEKGYTYQIDDGIYYDTSRFPRYADFAHLNLKDLQAGARVEFNQQKRGAADFALWKFTPKGTKRDMEWETPADLMDNSETGRMGFPGWHLECSAIIKRELGDTIDIHTGGIEHIPVHHTNEIAQSEAANDKPFVNYWLHAHHLTADGAKMSKSLGNGYTLDDVNERGFSHMDFKMWVLQGHFQSDRNFTFEDLAAAHQRLLRWRNAAALRHQVKNNEGGEQPSRAVLKAILNAVSDNLGTPQAMALADQAFVDIWNTAVSHISKGNLREFLDTIDELFGLNLLGTTPDISDDVKKLILQRERARDAKNWEESDRIRAEVEQHGIAIRDLPAGHGSVWEYSN
ncbi:MAG: cysteine--tRNA ligase, partial [Candidatus Nomurabacteria bacterium]|nr:cysteine--tRNA ligase [Candidatus Nomurabacteria bacterium]